MSIIKTYLNWLNTPVQSGSEVVILAIVAISLTCIAWQMSKLLLAMEKEIAIIYWEKEYLPLFLLHSKH